jgi:hypothetical protein
VELEHVTLNLKLVEHSRVTKWAKSNVWKKIRQNLYGYKKCGEFKLWQIDFDTDMLIENEE